MPFAWPELADDLAAGRFDVAMAGITVRPERSLVGRFSVPVAESGAVVLARGASRFDSVDAIDQRKFRIAVNAGGHLERVARSRFRRASLIVVPDNAAVLAALVGFDVDAAVTDTLEAPHWQRADPDLEALGPFTRDRKAYLFDPGRAALAADLDAWLLAREADGSLARLRASLLGAPMAPTATPLAALLAATDERLALMPLVVAAKREVVLPIADPAREKRVVEAGLAAVGEAARRARRPAPPDEAVRAFFRAQIDAAKQIQLAAGRAASEEPDEPAPDLEAELRPALLRIGERLAALLVALPADLDEAEVAAAARGGLRSPWLHPASRQALVDAITAVAKAPRSEPGDPGRPAPPQRTSSRVSSPATSGSARQAP